VLISQVVANTYLLPHHNDMRESLSVAWRKWQGMRGQFGRVFPRTIANNVHDLAMNELAMRLGSKPGIQIFLGEADRFFLTVKASDGEALIVRVKQLTPGFEISNYPTRRARRFNAQLPLQGVLNVPRLTLGYRLNTDRSELLGIYVGLSKGSKLVWKYALSESASVVPLSAQTELKVPEPVVTLKPDVLKKPGENDG